MLVIMGSIPHFEQFDQIYDEEELALVSDIMTTIQSGYNKIAFEYEKINNKKVLEILIKVDISKQWGWILNT